MVDLAVLGYQTVGLNDQPKWFCDSVISYAGACCSDLLLALFWSLHRAHSRAQVWLDLCSLDIRQELAQAKPLPILHFWFKSVLVVSCKCKVGLFLPCLTTSTGDEAL